MVVGGERTTDVPTMTAVRGPGARRGSPVLRSGSPGLTAAISSVHAQSSGAEWGAEGGRQLLFSYGFSLIQLSLAEHLLRSRENGTSKTPTFLFAWGLEFIRGGEAAFTRPSDEPQTRLGAFTSLLVVEG